MNRTIENPGAPGVGDPRPVVLAAGGVLGAIAASSCCIAPLVLFSLGASGAWLGNLSALAPYQPVFIVMTLGFLGGGFWVVHRQSRGACDDDASCARPLSRRIVIGSLWGASVLVLAAAVFPIVAPLLLDA